MGHEWYRLSQATFLASFLRGILAVLSVFCGPGVPCHLLVLHLLPLSFQFLTLPCGTPAFPLCSLNLSSQASTTK